MLFKTTRRQDYRRYAKRSLARITRYAGLYNRVDIPEQLEH